MSYHRKSKLLVSKPFDNSRPKLMLRKKEETKFKKFSPSPKNCQKKQFTTNSIQKIRKEPSYLLSLDFADPLALKSLDAGALDLFGNLFPEPEPENNHAVLKFKLRQQLKGSKEVKSSKQRVNALLVMMKDFTGEMKNFFKEIKKFISELKSTFSLPVEAIEKSMRKMDNQLNSKMNKILEIDFESDFPTLHREKKNESSLMETTQQTKISSKIHDQPKGFMNPLEIKRVETKTYQSIKNFEEKNLYFSSKTTKVDDRKILQIDEGKREKRGKPCEKRAKSATQKLKNINKTINQMKILVDL